MGRRENMDRGAHFRDDEEHADSMGGGRTILIAAEHEQIAELLAEFCSAIGHRAVRWPQSEPLEAAVRRTQPDLVMLDAAVAQHLPASWSDCLRKHEAGALLFSESPAEDRLPELAARAGAPYFTLPIAWGDFQTILSASLAR
jgi:DNA-binding response OmpR family regulator